MADENDERKAHNKKHAGRKAERKAEKTKHVQEYTDRQRNPKAFTFKSAVKAQKQFLRTQNLQHKKHHIPVVDRTPLEPPPLLIAIVGGPCAGKTTLMRSLIKISTKQRLTSIAGPVTVVSGKKRRITFVEVNNDINCMVDVAKVCDLALLLIDVTFGIEMELFEFLEICRSHGMPKIMGVLNHIDMMKDNKSLSKKKKALKHRFQVELYPGAKLFYLTGMIRDEYMIHEIKNLSRFISVSKFRPLTFRTTHPYVYVDRWEDLTNPENIRQNQKCDRKVVVYGYMRGTTMQAGQMVHMPGVGDFRLEDIQFLPDPCPLPDHNKKRSLHSEEKLVYAPFSGVGGVVYDKDAVYIELGGSQHGRYIMQSQREQSALMQKKHQASSLMIKSGADGCSDGEDDEEHNDGAGSDEDVPEVDPEGGVSLMAELQKLQDQGDSTRKIQVFAGGEHVTSVKQQHQNHYNNPGLRGLPDYESVVDKTGRVRRRALEADNSTRQQQDNSDEEDSEDEAEHVQQSEAVDESEDEPLEEGDESENENDEGEVKAVSDDSEEEQESDTEQQGKEEDESSDESDVDNIVPKKDQNRYSDSFEPLAKKRKTDSTSVVSSLAKPTKTIQSSSTDAFSKIQDVLQSFAQPADDRDEEHSGTDDNGYSSCDDDGSNSKMEVADGGGGDDKDRDSKSGEQFQRAMFEEAQNAYFANRSSAKELAESIYGDGPSSERSEPPPAPSGQADNPFDDDDFLQVQVTKLTINDQRDTSFWTPPDLARWNDEKVRQSIKDCFVTGTWKESEDAATLLKLDDEDENMYGEFEDLETGQKFGDGNEKEAEEDGTEATSVPSNTGPTAKTKLNRREKLLAKKRKLKEMFDSEYEDKSDFFDSWKADMSQQAELNRSEFDSLGDDVRVLYEGFRPGMYVRMAFSQMPCEFVINFDPTYPVIVGGLLDNETKNVYNRVRMKVHRWYPKILKNRDPLILSVGWRRIQTMMYYGKREDDLKLRSLKYAKKYLHVEALFWGPYSPVSTGFVAFQSVAHRVANFRIAANGVNLEADKTSKLMKKLKLIGHPSRVLNKTSYITDMFHSDTEVVRFVGAKIQTQSSIRGLIKTSSGLKGEFRAKFEDTIKMSDVVILKTWANVEVAQYCAFVRSLLLSPSEKAHWQGMKTVGEIKKEKNIKNMPNPDSLYTEITRRRRYDPKPLKIPRSLQAALPYKYKPKHERELPAAERVLVVKDPHEEKMDKFMHRLRDLMADKIAKDKEISRTKKTKFLKEAREKEMFKANREKSRKTAACKKFSLKNSSKRN